jgi:hypothetical protein
MVGFKFWYENNKDAMKFYKKKRKDTKGKRRMGSTLG